MRRKIVSLLCALSVFSTILLPLKSAQAISFSDITNAFNSKIDSTRAVINSKIDKTRSIVAPFSSAVKSTVLNLNLGSLSPIKKASAKPLTTTEKKSEKKGTNGLSSSVSGLKNSLTTKVTNFTASLSKSINGISLGGLSINTSGFGNTISNTVNSKLNTIRNKFNVLNSKLNLNTLKSFTADVGNALKGFSPIGIAGAASVSAKNYDKGRFKNTKINKISLGDANSRSWDSEFVRAGGSSKSSSLTSQYQREKVLSVLSSKEQGFFGRLALSSNQGKSDEQILKDLERDYSGQMPIWSRLNEAERGLCFEHPASAPVVFACKELADKQVARYYGNSSIDGTESNAFRHACWNAYMTLYLGEDLAEEFANAHEALGDDIMGLEKADGYTYREHCNMDFHNNEVGRSCVQQGEDVSWDEVGDRVKQKVDAGEMKILVK